MARRLVDRNTALIIGLGSALYPHWIYFGTWIIAESLLFFLLGLAMWLLAVFHTRRNISILAVVGVLLGLSALAKPTVLFFTAFIVAWLFFAPERISIARRVANVAVLGVCVGLVIFPWTLRNYQVNGQLVLISTNGGYTFYGVNNPYAWGGHDEGFPVFDPKLNSAQNEDVFYQRAFEWIRSNPGEFMKLLPIKYSRLLSPLSVGSWKQDFPIPGSFFIYPIYYLYLIVAFCGMVLLIPRWRKFGFLYAPVLGVMASTGLFYGHARFTLPMAPALVFFTAAFILSAWQWISKILIRRTQSTP
jgi:4-amino-4-deoxy-L-arabinose transferase-like glycosyltransferase